jgi:ketosteroid isomerase-like protein
MKRLMIAIVLMLIVPCLIFGQTKPTEEQNAVQEVTALERTWSEAESHGDVAWFERHFADSYIGTDALGGVSDKVSMIAGVKNKVAKIDSTSTESLKVQVYGDAAVATSIEVVKKGTYKGKDAAGKYRWTDTWIKLAGRWQCVASHGSRIVAE